MGITLMVPQVFEKLEIGDLQCEHCSASHYLSAKRQNGNWRVEYDRYTLRYPSENYEEFPHFRVMLRDSGFNGTADADEPHEHYGPIVVYERKRFSTADVRQIWRQSEHRCHLCGKAWKLGQRGVTGWHIDHVIPNIGGGKDTEMMANFRVACAGCNLQKGRGHISSQVEQALKSLFP